MKIEQNSPDLPIEMTERQREIYKGLKTIGPKMATFYVDAIRIANSGLKTKPYLLAHLAREIGGGYRDVFGVKVKAKNRCEKDGHKKSIQSALGATEDSSLAQEWLRIADQFPEFAHRGKIWKDPSSPDAFDHLWAEFEEVLYKIVGNYYAIADSLDVLTNRDSPTEHILGTLPNLLDSEDKKFYFFGHLKSLNWLSPLRNLGYFDSYQSPKPAPIPDEPGRYSIPQWPALIYLQWVSAENAKSPDTEITRILDEIVDKSFEGRSRLDETQINVFTDSGIFKIICGLPESSIKQAHFEFIRSSLDGKWESLIGLYFETFLQRLVHFGNRLLLLEGIKILLKFRKVQERDYRNTASIFRDFKLAELLKEFRQPFIEICGRHLVELAIQKCEELQQVDRLAFLDVYTIEESDQNSFPDEYAYQLTSLTRDAMAQLPADQAREIVESVFKKEVPILRRIVLHVIGRRFGELGDLFRNSATNPLIDPTSKHEVYELLHLNASNFSRADIDLILGWIKECTIDPSEELTDAQQAYRSKWWLTALKGSQKEAVAKELEEVSKVYTPEVDHPGMTKWSSGLVGSTSPLSSDEILGMSISSLIEYFLTFKPKENDFFGPSTSGLEDATIGSIEINPEHFSTDCFEVTSASRQFQHVWMRGLANAWRDKKKVFEIDEVLQVVIQIFANPDFWVSYSEKSNHSKWFVMNLLSFLEAGLRDDSQAFDPKHLPAVKGILLQVFAHQDSDVYEYEDLTMTAVNSASGKVYICLLQYSLRLARIEKKESDRWDPEIKEVIQERLSSNSSDQLLHLVLGWFLPQIMFLDSNWLKVNVGLVFPETHPANYKAGAIGYFSFNNQLYSDVFKVVNKARVFEFVLMHAREFSDDVLQHMTAQLCSGYLHSNFDLDSEVLVTLLKQDHERIFSQVIYFFWSPQQQLDPKFEQKIKSLWKVLYAQAISLQRHVDKQILSGCCKWINNVSSIDNEVFDLMKGSSRYIDDRDFYAVLDGLAIHITNQPEKVGLLLIEIFSIRISPIIQHDRIIKLVEALYTANFKVVADRICVLHANRGIEYLRPTYNKHNK